MNLLKMYVKYPHSILMWCFLFSINTKESHLLRTVIHQAGIWVNIGNKERSSTHNRPNYRLMRNNKLHTDRRYREISGEFKHYLTLGQFNPRRSAQFSFLLWHQHILMPLRLYLMCLTNAEFYRESANTILSFKNDDILISSVASNRLTFTMLTIYWGYHKTWGEDAAIKIMPQISMFILRLSHFFWSKYTFRFL